MPRRPPGRASARRGFGGAARSFRDLVALPALRIADADRGLRACPARLEVPGPGVEVVDLRGERLQAQLAALGARSDAGVEPAAADVDEDEVADARGRRAGAPPVVGQHLPRGDRDRGTVARAVARPGGDGEA